MVIKILMKKGDKMVVKMDGQPDREALCIECDGDSVCNRTDDGRMEAYELSYDCEDK